MSRLKDKDIFDLNNLIPENLEISTKLTTYMRYVPTHAHTYYEIFYVINGTLKHKLNGVEHTLNAGEGFLLTPIDTHSIISNGDSVHRDILVSKELFISTIQLITKSSDTNSLINQLKNKLHFSLSDIVELENLAQKFDNTPQITIKRGIALTLLFNILTKVISSDNETANNSSISNKILDCLNNLYCLQGGIPAIAKHLKYSRSYLCNTFKKEIGIPLSLYIKNLRLDYIVYYLKTTNYSLNKIADIVGIESLPYLNKIFKEKYSIPPISYRKQYKTIEEVP